MRRATFVIVLMLAMLSLVPLTASAIWNQPKFNISGDGVAKAGVAADTTSLILLNDAGIQSVVSGGNTNSFLSWKLAANLDSLRLHHTGFTMQNYVYAELGTDSTLFKNEYPAMMSHKTAILAKINAGLNNPSVGGWFIWDEPPGFYPGPRPPDSTIFIAIHDMVQLVRDSTNGFNTSNKLPYVIMVPLEDSLTFFPPGFGTDTLGAYRAYLDEYLSRFNADGVPAPVLAFDSYPFEADLGKSDFRRYFLQLATIRDKAAQYSRANYRIPFWSEIQCAPDTNNPKTPSFPLIRWQAYVSLAYGAKGIQYFPMRPYFNFGNGFLTDTGTKNGALYDSLKALNGELSGLGPILMTLDPVATYHQSSASMWDSATHFALPVGEDTFADTNLVYQIVSRVQGSATSPHSSQGMIGYFKAHTADLGTRGDDYLLVVNKDTSATQTFTVTLANPPSAAYHYVKASGTLESANVTDSSFTTIPISPGGGELYKIVDKIDEYIPNINRMALSPDKSRMYYAHNKGVVVVHTSGWRTYFNDAANYTPIVGLAVDATGVFMCLNNGSTGSVAKGTNVDLTGSAQSVFAGSGLPSSIALKDTCLYVGFSRATSAGKTLLKIGRAGSAVLSSSDTTHAGRSIRDVQVLNRDTTLVVANEIGALRFSYPTALKAGNSKTARLIVSLAVGTGDSIFEAADTTTAVGKLRKTLPDVSAYAAQPPYTPPTGDMVYASADTTTNRILVAVDSSAVGSFQYVNGTTGVHVSVIRADSIPAAAKPRSTLLVGLKGYMATRVGMTLQDFTSPPAPYRYALRGRSGVLTLSSVPEPAFEGATVRFSVPRTGNVQLAVYDAMGRRVEEVIHRPVAAGVYSARWTGKGLRSGIYYMRLQLDKESITRRVTLIR